jgi:hypothetical protein
MRCKCCDARDNVKFTKGDFYCVECINVINEVIQEDRSIHELVPSWMMSPKELSVANEESEDKHNGPRS